MSSGGTARRPEPCGRSRETEQAGRYLTDGINLYRHMGAISNGPRQMIGLENCRTLDVVLMTISELRARRLRPVTPLGSLT